MKLLLVVLSLVCLPLIARGDDATGDEHAAAKSVEQLDVHPELEVKLFASEPMLTNPASIDVDHLGRVWVCEAINYRAFANADVIGDRQEGDRILVLEDTDGDAQADSSTVFYQGHDVDSAHGILVLATGDGKETKALVSALDSVFFLIDDDGDLKADRKEMLFTGIGGVQHDHGVHAFHFGPDGKLYFNMGNAGEQIKDKEGRPIVDRMGHEVNDLRQPYQEGMVFRCNLDGSGFETLAWNFRNNWEVCVDSFGTMWQSDNDDDGNQGVRINYVMDYGNYGYNDELTGAAWSEPRTNIEPEIPRRHWHLNDPGVIPNLLQTGAGAPTGICVYEGNLLPEAFRGALIHTDAGPNICRAYRTKPEGAGYAAEVVDVIDGSRNQWFRPSDVCVAPDGSLFVADWYDPGVGGHRMQDVARGRLYRVTPRGAAAKAYKTAAVDVSTPAGAASALQSPNMATRYVAWMALQAMGKSGTAALRELFASENPAMRARAMWALGYFSSIHTDAALVVLEALKDRDPNVRVAGIRLAREMVTGELHGLAFFAVANVEDPSPAVRREMLLWMHDAREDWKWHAQDERESMASRWAQLALQYDGKDRWYLEALGIAAEGHWDECLKRLEQLSDVDWRTSAAARDIWWRSRGAETSARLATIIADPQTPLAELPRYFRALDFQSREAMQAAVEGLAFDDLAGLSAEQAMLVRAEALNRLEGCDLSQDAARLAALDQALDACRGTEQFVRLTDKFRASHRFAELLTLAQGEAASQLAVDALAVLYASEQCRPEGLFDRALRSDDAELVSQTLAAMTTAADPRGNELLLALALDADRPLAARRGAVKALGANAAGAEQLLQLAQRQEFPEQLKEAWAAALAAAPSPEIRTQAAAIFPAPPTKDSTPLPSLAELVEATGDAERGRVVFNATGTCRNCHQVNGDGTEVGPDLSEIGKKLARPAMFESILYPSAAISHNFENWVVLTDDGLVHGGLLVSETEGELKLKDEKGIVRTIPAATIEEKSKSEASLMPADIQKLMTAAELVDLVEYLTTLKERR